MHMIDWFIGVLCQP